MVKNRVILGVATFDGGYSVRNNKDVGKTADGRRIRVRVWECPFYKTWYGMLNRCYGKNYQKARPTYKDCTVCEEWLIFSNFKAWMESQDWKDKELDKDLLVKGNKVYSPDTCVFVTSYVNSFIPEHQNNRGQYPIGVCWSKQNKKYKAGIGNRMGSNITLGYFSTPEEAHAAWLTAKLEQAKILAAEQTDPRVAKALVERYENYMED